MNRHVAFLQVCCIRYVGFYMMPCWVAALAGGAASGLLLSVAVPFWVLSSVAAESANRISDRVEDRINQPERTALCELVGYRRLAAACAVCGGASAAMAVAWLIWAPNLSLVLLLGVGLFAALNYSWGLRLKTRRYLSTLMLTMPLTCAFLAGWSLAHPNPFSTLAVQDLVSRVFPLILLMGTFGASLGGIKDITDADGDEAVGFHSLWVTLVRARSPARLVAVACLPFATLLAQVAAGVLATRFLILMVFLPVALALAHAARSALDAQDRHAVRELMYHAWFGFSALALYAYHPTAAAAATILSCTAFWFVASQRFHWSGGIRAETWQRILALDWRPFLQPRGGAQGG